MPHTSNSGNHHFHFSVWLGTIIGSPRHLESILPCNYQLLPHLGIQTLQAYIPGKPSSELERELGITDIIKLASNENPLGCSPNVLEALSNLSGLQIASYPAPSIHLVKSKLSQKLAIEEERITLGNGSDFLFTLLMIVFGLHSNKQIVTHDIAFMTYSIQAQTLGIPLVSTPLTANWEVDIPALIKACHHNTALVFLANPNNPTGILIPHERIQQLLAALPTACLLIIDEAYYEFAYPADDKRTLALLDEYPNLVITRTFSKAYGLAGLRLGYAISSREISELLHRVQLPFSVNQAAMEAGVAALEDEAFLANTRDMNRIGLQQMSRRFGSITLVCLAFRL